MSHPTAHHRSTRWQRVLAGFDRREQELARVQQRHTPVAESDAERTAVMPVIVDGPGCGFKGHEPGDPGRATCPDCASTTDIISHYAVADEPELATMVQPRRGGPDAVHADVVLAELWAEVERPATVVEPIAALVPVQFAKVMPVAAVQPWLPPVEPEPEPDPIDLAVAELLATWDANFALHMRELGLARKVEMAVSL